VNTSLKGGKVMKVSSKSFEDGKKLMIDGKVRESIEAFSKAIQNGEDTDTVFMSRGVAYLRNHETDKAIGDFDHVVKHSSHNVRAHFYKGIAHLNNHEYEAAVSEFDRTIELNPEHGAAFFARGAAYVQLGNDELASKNIKTAITLSESNVYGLQESIGLWRTEFDRALSQLSGDKKAPELTLTSDEQKRVLSWLEEGYSGDKYH
jgi:Flp pilus assembly protein TadD